MAFSLKLKNLFSDVGQVTSSVPLTAVGIDIGGASIKVVEIEETPKTIVLRTYGELQLGPYDAKPLGEVVSLKEQNRVEAVTDVIREAGVIGKKGTLAMPLSSSFLTVISLTLSEKEDLSNRIPVEARKYVPLPLTDVTLDWTELPSMSEKTTTQEIMLAAVENKSLEDYRNLMSTIGMSAEPAEIEAFSLIRAMWKQSDDTLAVFDIGARTIKLYIVRDGVLERLHRVGQGGREITRRVAESMNIPFEDAENLKRSADQATEQGGEIFKISAAVVGPPFAEFRHILEQYEARLGKPLGRVVISGGVASTPRLIDYIKDQLGRPVEIADPFAKLAYPAFMEDTLREIGPSFGVALGAALRQFQ